MIKIDINEEEDDDECCSWRYSNIDCNDGNCDNYEQYDNNEIIIIVGTDTTIIKN